MPGVPEHTVALVLARQPAGADKFDQLTLFSPAHGLLAALARVSRKPTAPTLDLFDEAEFWLESSNQGRTWFVKEHQLVRRPEGIGRSYAALQCAAAVAALIARNPVSDDSREPVADLLRRTFAALAEGARPDIVWLKSLYCFLRDEGYPVRQQWWPQLPADARDTAARLLNQPAAALAGTDAAEVTRVVRHLEHWLHAETELRLG